MTYRVSVGAVTLLATLAASGPGCGGNKSSSGGSAAGGNAGTSGHDASGGTSGATGGGAGTGTGGVIESNAVPSDRLVAWRGNVGVEGGAVQCACRRQ
jgi:hypothetical protein